jgi:membrane-associated phospholipid phosphatase
MQQPPIAAATALTRVDRDKHWASDTFVGAAIGYFVGKTVARYNPFLEKHNMAVVPSADDGQYSLSLVHRF